MNVKGHIVNSANLSVTLSAKSRFRKVENLREIANFNMSHDHLLPTIYVGVHSIFQNMEYEYLLHPAIIGTAANAATMPIVRARLKCSCRKMRASRTVTAG